MPMLSKAATSFRPFLRLQSHQPDLFTSNPSLLHHFQQHGLVAQGAAQTATGSGGAAGGAGRAYSGASSGGYTGHARAFLSLPGSGADISAANTSAEEREKTKARQRAGLALKQRGSGASVEQSSLPRTVMMKDRMAQRAGSRHVAMVEMREDAEDAELEGSGRRGSIAYPSWSGLPSDAAPGGALWMPGAAPRPIGARAFSTAVRHTEDEEIPVPMVSAVPGADAQRIDQPNRVLQDLAGLDLGRPGRPGQKRRNSTASVVRSDADLVIEGGEKSLDLQMYQAINKARYNSPEEALALIAHYRTPRSATQPAKGDPALADRFPLDGGYSTATYNLCLEVTLEKRQRGESIAPILDMYNEMLARDVVPNMRTTALVIRALCLREEDVSAASLRWAHSNSYQEILRNDLGLSIVAEEDNETALEAIQAYQSENNLQSALNLYSIASSFYPSRSKSESAVLADLIKAASTSIGFAHALDPAVIRPLIKSYVAGQTLDTEALPSVFDLLAAYKDEKLLRATWERVVKELPEFNPKCTDDARRAAKTTSNASEIRSAVIRAFVSLGDKGKATEIVQSIGHNEREYRNDANLLVTAFAQGGDVDGALKWMKDDTKGTRWNADTVFAVAEALLTAGRYAEAVNVVTEARKNILQDVPGSRLDVRRVRYIYAAVMGATLKNPTPELIDTLGEAAANCYPAMNMTVLGKHIEILLQAGRYSEIGPMLLRYPARSQPLSSEIALWPVNALLRDSYAAVVTSDAPIAAVLDVVRGFARLGHPIAHKADSIPVPTVIVDKYVASRARVQNVSQLGIQLDGWFRLMEAFDAVPSAHIDAGAIDAALETFLADIAEAQKAGLKLPNTYFTSPSVAELATILEARFGVERANELLTTAFGDRASHLISTPPASNAATSEAEFTLPPTPASAEAPPSTLQPPSAHTLHLNPKLVALVDSLAAPRALVTPVQVYNTIRESIANENAVPTPEAIGRLIAALARAGDEQKARELYSLAQVVLASCVPDPHAQAEGWRAVEDSMIAACCFLGQLEQAGMHRARIIEAGMAPSADAYATMIASSRDSTDDALVARELFDESQSLGVVPHLYLFNTIISKLSKARKAEMAIDLFQHMKAAGIRPSSVTYGAVINACCRVGDAESAEVLFEEMCAQPNFKPRVPPFNTMMQFHLQTRPSRPRVLYYYDAMRSAGVRPSAHTYKLLLDAYGTLSPVDLTAMNRVFGELCADRKVPVQGTHWASLITAFGLHANDVTKALAVFESIATHPSTTSAVPEPVVWEAILNVLGQKGNLEQLESMRARLDASGARPTAYVCNVLISGYAKHGRVDKAREVFEAMVDSQTGVAAPNNHPALLTSSGHVKPSTTTAQPTNAVYREPSTYEAMVRAELLAGERARAEAVLSRMEERRYPVAVWMKARAILDEQL